MESFFLDAFWYAGVALDAVLAVRLFQLRLVRRYPVLTFYLCFEVVRDIPLAYLLRSHRRLFGLSGYGVAYIVSQPVIWALCFLLVLELYSRMLEEYPGIRRLGRLVLLSALASITLACSVVIAADHQAGFDRYPFISYLILQSRSVYLCLSTLALLLLLFVAYYRIPIRRNVWVVYCCFSGFFLTQALLYTLRRYFGSAFGSIRDVAGALVYVALLLGSVVLFSRAGEAELQPVNALWERRDPELEAALSLQLQGFNQTLVRVLR